MFYKINSKIKMRFINVYWDLQLKIERVSWSWKIFVEDCGEEFDESVVWEVFDVCGAAY